MSGFLLFDTQRHILFICLLFIAPSGKIIFLGNFQAFSAIKSKLCEFPLLETIQFKKLNNPPPPVDLSSDALLCNCF